MPVQFNFQTSSILCSQCKGACFVKDDNKATQKNAFKRFGIIPNNCVSSNSGDVHCPYQH